MAVPTMTLAEPSTMEPSLKVTVPVAAEGETVAVRVTGWVGYDGFGDEVSTVVVAGATTF